MYLDPFKLKELPFRLSPDPQFLYLSKQHARAKAYMESTIWFTDGFVVITGEIGSGKTTLIESFLKEIQSDVVIAQINQTQVSAIDFLQAVLVQFGFSPFKMKKAELIATLNNFLIEQYAAGRKVLLADFDIEQRTCMRWQAQRQARRLEPAIDVEKFSKEAKLDRVSHRYDDVILDTPGLMRR